MSSRASGRGPIFLISLDSMNLRSSFPLKLFRSVCRGGEEISAIEAVG